MVPLTTASINALSAAGDDRASSRCLVCPGALCNGRPACERFSYGPVTPSWCQDLARPSTRKAGTSSHRRGAIMMDWFQGSGAGKPAAGTGGSLWGSLLSRHRFRSAGACWRRPWNRCNGREWMAKNLKTFAEISACMFLFVAAKLHSPGAPLRHVIQPSVS